MTRFLKTLVLTALAMLVGVSRATAQDASPADNTGFRPQNAYISYLPWESVNPYGGNVIWHFTDLVLPGNAGMNVAWERTWNSANHDAWRFGVSGIPIRIEEPGNGQLPVIFTPDGGASGTSPIDENDENQVFSGQLLAIYDRASHILHLPNGWRVAYAIDNGAEARFPTEVSDPFDNKITFSYSAAQLTYQGVQKPLLLTGITQTGPEGVTGANRHVTIAYDAYDRVDTVSVYGRTWTYEYESPNDANWYVDRLARVELPDGTSWQFSVTAESRTVTTPLGGTVTYTFAPHVMDDLSTKTVLTQRVTGGQAVVSNRIPSGTWTYEYENHSLSLFRATNITTPSGRTIVYSFFNPENNFEGGAPSTILVKDATNAVVQEEHFTYGDVEQADDFPSERVLTDHTITRDGRTCSEHYTYSPVDHADFHTPSLIEQSGCGATRTIERWFKNVFNEGTYLKHVLTDEFVDGIATRHVSPDLSTGFVTSAMAGGLTQTFAPTAGGNVASVTDSANRTVSYEYSKGVTSAVHYGLSDLDVSSIINDNGTVASQSRHYANGTATTTFGYDAATGQLTTVTPPSPANQPTTIAYLDWGGSDPRTRTTSGTYSTTTRVNGFGQAYASVDSFDVETWTKYDAEGRVVEQALPFVGTVAATEKVFYDALGRVKRREHADAKSVLFEYGQSGSSGTVTITDERGNKTKQVWQGFGSQDDARLVQVTDADQKTWSYGYDALGHLTLVTAPDNSQRSWSYTGHGNAAFNHFFLRQETQPESGTTTLVYNGDGSVYQKTDANGSTFSYTYDAVGRLSQANASGRVTTLTYEPGSSNIATVTAPDAYSEYAYDVLGNLAARTDLVDGMLFSSAFAYDYTKNGGLEYVTYPSGRHISYTLDAAGRPTAVTDGNTGTAYASAMQYTPGGALKSYQTGNGLVHTMSYDEQRGWLTEIKAVKPGVTDPLLHFTYDAHDEVGNIKHITDQRNLPLSQTFTYDVLNRMTSAWNANFDVPYAYDAHGNRATIENHSTYTYDATTLRLTGVNGESFGYDYAGSLVSIAEGGSTTATFQYFPEGAMHRSTVGGVVTDYRYGGDGWRIKQQTGNSVTYYLRGAGGSTLTEWPNPQTFPWKPRDFIYAGGKLIAAVTRTIAQDVDPATFAFTDQSGLAPTTFLVSNIVQVTGITGLVPVTIDGPGGAYRICADSTCSTNPGLTNGAGSIANGQYLQLAAYSSAAFSTQTAVSITVGGGTDTWYVTTAAQDVSPDPFTFADQTVAQNTFLLSNIVPVTGITGAVTVTIGANGGAYRICSDSTCSSDPGLTRDVRTITNGQYLQLAAVSSGTFSGQEYVSITVGSGGDTWYVTTAAQDTLPDPVSFWSPTGIWPGTTRLSNVQAITGVTGTVAISISGSDGHYRVCADATCSANPGFTQAPSTVTSGQYIQLAQTSSSTRGATVQTTVTVGSGAANWQVTTVDPGVMLQGHALGVEELLFSPSGTYGAYLQSDGNFVVRRNDGELLWASGTHGTSPGVLALQGDGNLVLYAGEGPAVWATMTFTGVSLTMQDDGNLVLRDAAGNVLWMTFQ